jgi:hypothetical protein
MLTESVQVGGFVQSPVRARERAAVEALTTASSAVCRLTLLRRFPAGSPQDQTHLSAACDRIVAATLAALDLRTGQTRRIEVYGPQCVTEVCAPAGYIARVWVWTWGGLKPELADVSQANGRLSAKRAGNL